MSPETRRAINADRDAIREVIAAATTHADEVRDARGDLWVLAAGGGILHSFYTGVENILKVLAGEYGEPLPTGEAWHASLLKQLFTATPLRPAVLDTTIAAELKFYLGFRHVYRSYYAMRLDAARVAKLIDDLPAVWQSLESALDRLDAGDKPAG